jgi:Zn-dependent protease with chaperone function
MNPIALIALLLEWVMLVSVAAASVFTNNTWLYRRPHLGVILWFAAFATAGVATALAVFIAFSSAFEAWLATDSNDPWVAIAASFAPWLMLAIGGISLALVTQKMEQNLEPNTRQKADALKLLPPSDSYKSIPIITVPTDEPLALSFGKSADAEHSGILISQGALDLLTDDELLAVLEHEYFHLKSRHWLPSSAAKVISLLSFRVITSRLLAREVSLLLELAADKHSATKHNRTALRSALIKLAGESPNRELRLRLAHLQDIEGTATN